MLFSEALTRLRDDMFPEQGIQTHSEERFLRLLTDSAVDTATSFGFLIISYRINLAKNQTTETIPEITSGSYTYIPRLIQRIERAVFEGWNLKQGSRVSQGQDEAHFAAIGGVPRFWYWKPERPDSITILPRAHKAGTLTFDAIQMFPRTPNKDVQMWAGMHEAYQDIVILEAAKRAFAAGYESDMPAAQGVQERLSRRRQEFSLHLQRSDLSEIPVGQGG